MGGRYGACFFLDRQVVDGYGCGVPLLHPPDEVTGDSSELIVGLGPPPRELEAEQEGEDGAETSSSCSSCLCSFSTGRQPGAPGTRARPPGLLHGADSGLQDEPQGRAWRGGDRGINFDDHGMKSYDEKADCLAVYTSSSEDEADSWRRVAPVTRAGDGLGRASCSNNSCVVEFKRCYRQPSQPAGRTNYRLAAAAAVVADRAERDRDFWETCLASGYP